MKKAHPRFLLTIRLRSKHSFELKHGLQAIAHPQISKSEESVWGRIYSLNIPVESSKQRAALSPRLRGFSLARACSKKRSGSLAWTVATIRKRLSLVRRTPQSLSSI